jgi:hypothetical protein
MLRHIVAVGQKLQIVLPRQIGDEFLISIRLLPAQLVIEMNDGKNNPESAAQFQQQPQESNRVDPARNGNSNAIPGTHKPLLPNVRQQAHCEGMHENMVQQYWCGDSRRRLP